MGVSVKYFYSEGYGCALNLSETEMINGFLVKNDFIQIQDLKKADFVIINTCSVKQVTEQRMVSRIKNLLKEKKPKSKLLVFGCLASAQHETIEKINPEIIVLDNNLASLCNALKIPPQQFSPKITPIKSKEFISIIPLSTGCLNFCTYCSTRLARKMLKSYSTESILSAFRRAINGDELNKPSKEIWLTSQDLGCYGFDINSSLVNLLKQILKINGNYRIRLGMMNPNHFIKIKKDLLPIMKDERIYKFLHLPLQSGSNKILKLMNRTYSVEEFIECVNYARKIIPNITIATDIIVGFPNENCEDFKETIKVLEKTKPDIVNISRFGKRKGTYAEKMKGQLTEKEKKNRSRILSNVCKNFFLKNCEDFLGKEILCLVSEKTKNGFNAHTNEYKTVFVKKGYGDFVKARITQIKRHYFIGEVMDTK